MRIIIVGPGRAGLALATACQAAGHDVVAVVGRTAPHAAAGAAAHQALALGPGDPWPDADLVVIATRDDAIAPVAGALVPQAGAVAAAVHLSGLTPLGVLAPLAAAGLAIGSFHPLQTLPTPAAGATRLAGAWIAVTAAEPLRTTLGDLARSLGAHPFDLADEAKPIYHAGAAAAANLPLAALAMASDLFAAAGVPFAAARPLVEAVVANAFELGPRPALTGPVVRGDVATVAAQLEAVGRLAPQWLPAFSAGVMTLARLVGRADEMSAVVGAAGGERS